MIWVRISNSNSFSYFYLGPIIYQSLLHTYNIHADLGTARQLMGPNAIIGVTCSSLEEAYAAATGGADYLGIGTMYATPT